MSGIVYGILTFGQDGKLMLSPEALLQDLSSIVRDHYTHVIDILSTLIDQSQE